MLIFAYYGDASSQNPILYNNLIVISHIMKLNLNVA